MLPVMLSGCCQRPDGVPAVIRSLSLPQHDPLRRSRRNARLQKMQKLYAFSLTYNGNIATIDRLPRRERPGLYYYLQSVKRMLPLIPSLPGLFLKFIKFGFLGRPFEKSEDYFFFDRTPFPDPDFRENFRDDFYFGRQCVAGTNPVMIEGVNEQNPLPATFRPDPAALDLDGKTLEQAMAQDRLYMLNYAMLKPLTTSPGTVDGIRKYLKAPIALFYLQDNRHLRPLAVQMDVTEATGPGNRIYTPADGQQWKLARTCVMTADATVHDLWIHATQIHYVMESVIMVSHRQLAKQHPLMVLLAPHLRYTLSVNVQPLYQPNSLGKRLFDYSNMFACSNAALIEFMGQGMRAYSFRDRRFPTDIRNRHVQNPLLDYPYRDGGAPLWDLLQSFAREYVGVYYRTDEDVLNDYELQAWASELGGDRHTGKCGLNDFPTRLTTPDEVAEIIGHILFICTAHHSTIHYPQYQYAGYPPNMPSSLYQSPEIPPEEYQTEAQFVRFFPNFRMALNQVLVYYLVCFRVNRMDEYDLLSFDRRSAPVIKRHREKLRELSRKYREKEKHERLRYPFMDPLQVPASVTA